MSDSNREFRSALLIGQNRYAESSKFKRLEQCHNDVDEMEWALTALCGFQHVICFKDAARQDFATLIKQLMQTLKGRPNSMILLFYAGHSVSINGEFLLVPVDAKRGQFDTYLNANELLRPIHDFISHSSIGLARRTGEKNAALPSPGTCLITIFDSCRERDCVLSVGHIDKLEHQCLSAGGSLHPKDSQVLQVYACDDGAHASEDGDAHHGFLTEAFLYCLEKNAGSYLLELLESVTARCQERSGKKQRPWTHNCCLNASQIVLRQDTAPATGEFASELVSEDEFSRPESIVDCLRANAIEAHAFARPPSQQETQHVKVIVDRVCNLVQKLISWPELLSSDLLRQASHILQCMSRMLPASTVLGQSSIRFRGYVYLSSAKCLLCQTVLSDAAKSMVDECSCLLSDSVPCVAFVGPTSAGKSTIVNAYLGKIVCPTNGMPQSLIPVKFVPSNEVDAFEIIPVGTGISEILDIHTKVGLSMHEVHEVVQQCTGKLRSELGSNTSVLLQNVDIDRWHLRVTVPGVSDRFAVVDCPGGTEGGAVGKAASRMITYQLQQASLANIVVSAENFAPLTDTDQLNKLFGGSTLEKDAMLIVTHIDNEKSRSAAESWLSKHSPDFGAFHVRQTFFLSGRSLLAYHVLKASLSFSFPPFGSKDFRQHFTEVEFCAHSVLADLDLEDREEYDEERSHLASRIERSYQRKWSDNSKVISSISSFVSEAYQDLLLARIRSRFLDGMYHPLHCLYNDYEIAREALAVKQEWGRGKVEQLDAATWLADLQASIIEAREEVRSKVNTVADLIVDDLKHVGKHAVSWSTARELIDSHSDTCLGKAWEKHVNFHLLESSNGLAFSSGDEAKHFFIEFMAWARREAHQLSARGKCHQAERARMWIATNILEECTGIDVAQPQCPKESCKMEWTKKQQGTYVCDACESGNCTGMRWYCCKHDINFCASCLYIAQRRSQQSSNSQSLQNIAQRRSQQSSNSQSLQNLERQAVRQHGLTEGDVVQWSGNDADVPKGSQGTVIGFSEHRVSVQFPKGRWSFSPSELILVDSLDDNELVENKTAIWKPVAAAAAASFAVGSMVAGGIVAPLIFSGAQAAFTARRGYIGYTRGSHTSNSYHEFIVRSIIGHEAVVLSKGDICAAAMKEVDSFLDNFAIHASESVSKLMVSARQSVWEDAYLVELDAEVRRSESEKAGLAYEMLNRLEP